MFDKAPSSSPGWGASTFQGMCKLEILELVERVIAQNETIIRQNTELLLALTELSQRSDLKVRDETDRNQEAFGK